MKRGTFMPPIRPRAVATPARLTVVLPALLLLSAVGGGCRPSNQFVPPPPPKVTVALPREEAIADVVEFTGTTKAQATVELRARAEGFLKQINFTEGTTVEAGTVLFVIDKEPYETALSAARAEGERAQAALQLADATLARTLQLLAQNATSRQQLDVDQAQRSTALANLHAAESSVRQAEMNLGYTDVKAPITGRIGRHLIDVGNFVQGEQTVLAVIESIDPIYTYFYVGERDLLRFMQMIRSGTLSDPSAVPPQIKMQLENETEYSHVGRLDFRELGVDPGTGTVLRRAVFDNPEQRLIPGLFARLQAEIGDPMTRLTVERRAIGYDQRGDYLLTVNADNIVEFRLVRLGVTQGDRQVVLEGIGKTDRVIVNGLQRARPGSKVDPQVEAAGATQGADGAAGPGKPASTGVPASTGGPSSTAPTGTSIARQPAAAPATSTSTRSGSETRIETTTSQY
jgi:RND family efflux transporter MFP subunit